MKPKKKVIKEICGNCFSELIRIQKGERLLAVYCPKCKEFKYADNIQNKEALTKLLEEVVQ
jgi:NMD protein affecting ribosome stability and mRNA decay